VQETVNSIYYMLKQRVADIEYKQEVRGRLNRAEQQAHDQ